MSTYAAAATAAATVVRDSKGPELQRVMAAMITVPFAFMALRFYCKMGSNKKFGWDDAVLLLSWVSRPRSIPTRTSGARGVSNGY